jgi:hypothetical protein
MDCTLCGAILETLTVTQPLRKLHAYTDPEGTLPCSRRPPLDLSEPAASSLLTPSHHVSLKVILTWSLGTDNLSFTFTICEEFLHVTFSFQLLLTFSYVQILFQKYIKNQNYI